MHEICSKKTRRIVSPHNMVCVSALPCKSLDHLISEQRHPVLLVNVELGQAAADLKPSQSTWAASPPAGYYCLPPPSSSVIGSKTDVHENCIHTIHGTSATYLPRTGRRIDFHSSDEDFRLEVETSRYINVLVVLDEF